MAGTPVTIDFASFFADHQRPIASALALTLRDDLLASDATAEAMAAPFNGGTMSVGTPIRPAGSTGRAQLGSLSPSQMDA